MQPRMKMLIVSDREVIRNVLQDRERYVAYLGAGVSIEGRA
jgi:hypothetical protein